MPLWTESFVVSLSLLSENIPYDRINIYTYSFLILFFVHFAASVLIEECYDDSINGNIPGIKDENGNWNTHRHPGRIVYVGQKELELFAKLFDGSDEWRQSKLPAIHVNGFVSFLELLLDKCIDSAYNN